jgi:guanylate kinase
MNNPLIILSGPSGAGKSTLCKKLFKKIDNYYFSISTTTREPRNGEKDGVDYYFVSKEEFKKSIKNKEFLEWAEVHGNYYGTSKVYIDNALTQNKLTILDIDVQGQEIIKKDINNLISIFISTSNLSLLKKRLTARQTDTKEQIDKRLNNAIGEIKKIKNYDFFLINDDLDIAFKEFYHIIKSCKNTISPDIVVENFINKWKI